MTSQALKSEALYRLELDLEGTLHSDMLTRGVYATDASAYQETPAAVAIPKTESDLQTLIKFARENGIGLIPRTAGTSLAGQVVGSGIVVDVSRNFTSILEVCKDSEDERGGWVRLQPGVIRNELNQALESHGLFFGPETSTQNRAMLGGMLGNNSCGSNSIKYGSVRDHIIEVTALLADGSKATFGELSKEEFEAKCAGPAGLETELYCRIRDLLINGEVREEITREFPKPTIPRRNTGYALDLLMDADCFDSSSSKKFNFAKLIAGSEGTLCFVTEMKLHCDLLNKNVVGLQCAQFDSVDSALRAAQIAVKYDCFACEIIDHFVLECTERSIEHRANRFFIEGEPQAVLVTEIRGDSEDDVLNVTAEIESDFRLAGLGYAYPVLFGKDTERIWDLRKAGLGLLSNQPGDLKPVAVIEDTAVDVEDLADYIREFNEELHSKFGLQCVHYAHAGSGEIHLRPIINLKTEEGNQQFREVAQTIARLVKKYRGSLSGEHGDGRLRGEFLKQMIGEKNYQLVEQIKRIWDPQNIFNPGKIVDTPPMNQSLRFGAHQSYPELNTVFDWSSTQGVLGAAEMCNGSGDCRKTHLTGGTMCPSYMATRDEKDTTRARANTLRNAITNSTQENPFDNEEIKEVMDLCLSCKGCKKECPSTVDMAKLKAEFQQHYYDSHGSPLRSKLIANFTATQQLAAWAPWAWNFAFGNALIRRVLNRVTGFHPDRTIPPLPKQTLATWFKERPKQSPGNGTRKVLLFNDEFTNYQDSHIGMRCVELLEKLGYDVEIPEHHESGRTWLSKGFVRKAKELIEQNVNQLSPHISENKPLIGIEPSAILTFRDEALELTQGETKALARQMAKSCYTFEEFIAREIEADRISAESFTEAPRSIRFHGHCFQKAITGTNSIEKTLSIPANYRVQQIRSGCCGMAGSFGYEKEHYDISMKIGELVLFPTVRGLGEDEVIAAPGTSCRHQIHDGTGRKALHPVEVLYEALR